VPRCLNLADRHMYCVGKRSSFINLMRFYSTKVYELLSTWRVSSSRLRLSKNDLKNEHAIAPRAKSKLSNKSKPSNPTSHRPSKLARSASSEKSSVSINSSSYVDTAALSSTQLSNKPIVDSSDSTAESFVNNDLNIIDPIISITASHDQSYHSDNEVDHNIVDDLCLDAVKFDTAELFLEETNSGEWITAVSSKESSRNKRIRRQEGDASPTKPSNDTPANRRLVAPSKYSESEMKASTSPSTGKRLQSSTSSRETKNFRDKASSSSKEKIPTSPIEPGESKAVGESLIESLSASAPREQCAPTSFSSSSSSSARHAVDTAVGCEASGNNIETANADDTDLLSLTDSESSNGHDITPSSSSSMNPEQTMMPQPVNYFFAPYGLVMLPSDYSMHPAPLDYLNQGAPVYANPSISYPHFPHPPIPMYTAPYPMIYAPDNGTALPAADYPIYYSPPVYTEDPVSIHSSPPSVDDLVDAIKVQM
jgi:hypothetical protein